MAVITSSKESLSQALQNRIIPNQEYLLQGSVLDSTVEHLKQRKEEQLR
ncbi:mediator of RNA polymerase II transcription subunit 18-like [Teleopsis dalmanni]|nr:mediator of RNA polymerase II transcription subunit 18-like [Teleopsis dalmanni]XP_037931081.1 mediator of RNA polymerase II transcription subunit 18-like [Teleopsis dalmanni]XP_037931087.1 mediator of RNA polymerase II transcription subunit 18-like [Teleopsis dalmanni]XP_037931090.1 mediator of RNA polymerase II transcription subunit 18-like [Teleopsis dalmanni]XP_037931092.1 mediator of RNA polymerase II transcription subunit 18-like [Teleopsis dalmanni]